MNIAQTGLDAQQTRLSIISNNLANVATTGYKNSCPNFEDLLYETISQPGASSSQSTELPSGLMLGTGVRTVSTAKIFTQGTLSQTENALDVAIQGRGFLQVLLPDGSTAYTRDGGLSMNSQGQIVTSSGYQVDPAITIGLDLVGHHRAPWHGLGADRRQHRANPDWQHPARGFHQPAGSAADWSATCSRNRSRAVIRRPARRA